MAHLEGVHVRANGGDQGAQVGVQGYSPMAPARTTKSGSFRASTLKFLHLTVSGRSFRGFFLTVFLTISFDSADIE